MFLEELADLKNLYPERLHLIHALSREPQEIALGEGRLDETKLQHIFDGVVAPKRSTSGSCAALSEW